MIGKVSGGTGRYLSYFGKDARRYQEVPGGIFPILVLITPILVLLVTYVSVPLGTPFVSTVRFLGMKDSH